MRRKLKEIFLAGLVVIVPLYLTLAVIGFVIDVTDRFMGLIPESVRESFHLNTGGYGLVLAVTLTFLAGFVVKSIYGHSFITAIERIIERLPFVSGTYRLFKQMSETLLNKDKGGFKEVVLVEWPRPGAWTIAFVASKTSDLLSKRIPGSHGEMLNLFLPTTPNPTSGFYFMVPRDAVKTLDMSVEEAFKTIVSCGTSSPDARTPDHAHS